MKNLDTAVEQVWVVPRPTVEAFMLGCAEGTCRDRVPEFIELIQAEGFFMDRPAAEVDESHLQIIPYVVIQREDAFFVVERLAAQGEARLHGKVSLGIGGHLNPEDGEPPFWSGVMRELREEVHITGYVGQTDLTPLGIIRDDSTPVGRVHCGVALLYRVPLEAEVTVAEVDKMHGGWEDPATLRDLYPRMESWSQWLFDHHIAPGLTIR
ncbi:MAG TPA: hypothetical protein VEI97_09340 [bacterium]|nr:hypothetical protein [bacterium]